MYTGDLPIYTGDVGFFIRCVEMHTGYVGFCLACVGIYPRCVNTFTVGALAPSPSDVLENRPAAKPGTVTGCTVLYRKIVGGLDEGG